MVITVTCPSCSSSFPVDPAKIPEDGVNARCSSCGDIFRVERPAEPVPEPEPVPEDTPVEAAPVATEEPPVVAREEAPVDVADPPSAVEDSPTGVEEVEVVPAVELPPVEAAPFEETAPAAPAVAEPAAEVAEAPADAGAVAFTFGKRDPTDKAKRLARVLVSDMIMYNAERHQSALENGTLERDFEEEIDKSWKEFVEQVGPEIADGDGRDFWRAALNDILAKGQELF